MARKTKRRDIEEASVPISAMIDIVFLLIIFFVVTASIDKEIEDEQVNLANAPHGKPLTKKDPRSFTINVRNDGTVNVGMMPATLKQITAQLNSAASKWGNDLPVIIRGDRNVQHEHIKNVMMAITETKLYRVSFNAVLEKEK